MLYPQNIEEKIGFNDIRNQLSDLCFSAMGREWVEAMTFESDATHVHHLQLQLSEMIRMLEKHEDFPTADYFDMRAALKRIRVIGAYLEKHEIWQLKRVFDTADIIISIFNDNDTDNDTSETSFPTLAALAQNISSFRTICRNIEHIFDKFGNIRDNASPLLADIRQQLQRLQNSIGGTLQNILRQAQNDGLIEREAKPTLRDGRLVIPVAPAMKRKIRGIVHDESATGKTIFIEPAEVVEANNKIRELEADERREIIRILQSLTDVIRPDMTNMLATINFIGKADFLHAKASLAQRHQAHTFIPLNRPYIDWSTAYNPILRRALDKHGKKAVPLDIELNASQRIIIISGPNAGGKSVCLKTVGLLQYMLQCGLAIPISESSRTGVFSDIMIDIGDEQSIENELSTYSSHLSNMKVMMRRASIRSLMLIDEFGGGTEPTIGGAMAEAMLNRFCQRQAFGIITTHYQNLKHFADNTPGVVNGAMLYDRQSMQALFTLSIGQPGSSFAIEIARKIGIPEDVIREASEIVGQDYINADKYLQDIVRDKMYWEQKRQQIHANEKRLAIDNEQLQREIEETRAMRRDILGKARKEAQQILSDSNARIEQTIRQIREAQAEKERTKGVREELKQFHDSISDTNNDDYINHRIAQIEARRKRKAERKAEKTKNKQQSAEPSFSTASHKTASNIEPLRIGDYVRLQGQNAVGTISDIKGKQAVVTFGSMRTNVALNRLERSEKPKESIESQTRMGISTRSAIDERRTYFRPEIDLRGMRADEALLRVQNFVDDAAMLGVSNIRILHGTGNGILRNQIRQYLNRIPVIKHYADEHVQFGGAGITVVTL